jgi:FlaG/FlaF family flagellin (archaellin)
MVAVAVILAAVVATFALGTTEDLSDTGPQAIIEVSDAPDDFDNPSDTPGTGINQGWEGIVDIVHEAGDPLPASEIEISIRNASSNTLIARWNGDNWVTDPNHDDAAFKSTRSGNNANPAQEFDSDPLSSGDRITPVIKDPKANQDGKYTVQITHKPTQTLITKQTVEVN